MTMPIRGRARWGALTLAVALLLSPAANAQNAYITNSGDGTVSVIDTATNKVTATIPVGTSPYGVAVTPDGTKVYVANGSDSTVSVIATASNTVIATIPGVFFPSGLAITADGTKAYVATNSTVSVIDTAINKVVGTPIPVGASSNGVAVTPDGTKVYLSHSAVDTVSVIATASNTVVATIPVGMIPQGVAVTQDGANVYVANSNSHTVSVIDTSTNTVKSTIDLGPYPYGVAIAPDGTKVYVTSVAGVASSKGAVKVIDTATNTVTTSILLVDSSGPCGVAVTPDGTKVYAANCLNGTVSVIDTATNTVTTSIPVGSFPYALGKFIGGPSSGSPPVAVPETATTTANTPVAIDLTAGASGNPTSAALVGTPAGGTVTGFPATTVTFTPTTDFSGVASFQFTLTNAFGTSNTATATITVAKGSPPVAVPEAASTSAGTPVTIDLSKGASGNPTSAAIVSGPTHGVLKFISNTMVRYKLTACFLGPDSFTFTLANAYGTSNVATATITITAVSAPTIAVHLVDPFLLGANLSNIDLTPLYHAQNWTVVQANGLMADNTSAAIAVIQTNDCANNVNLTTTNGTTLLPYSPNFLTTAPAAGTPSLPIAVGTLDRIGAFFYGAALVQAPNRRAAPSFTAPIVVTAQQGSQSVNAQASLVPPPVVLVHGLWGDRDDLGGDGKLAPYLRALSPWKENSKLWGFDFVQVPCYSKYLRFDAPTDPLPIADCEQTSKDALASTIYPLFTNLKNNHIVGYRVDVVAHSMGGLAARNYALQSFYRSLRNRGKGQFHEIITLDTPELGSKLAHFLDKHSSCTRQVSDPLNLNYIVWAFFCHSVSPSTTVTQCFENSGHPLAAHGYDLTSGAVYSLYPNGPALQNPKLPPPNIPSGDWRAMGSDAPDNSELEYVLNNLISAIYPSSCAPGTTPTIDGILGVPFNDAIVTLPSQLDGIEADHAHNFQGLSHIGLGLPAILAPGLSDANVLKCTDVNQLAACWLSRSGDSACLAGVPDIPACITAVSASKTASANKNAVPMPHIATAHPHSVDRLTLSVPAGLELGTPFDLAVNTGSGGLPELHVVQSSETGTQKEVPAAISRVEGQTVYLSVTPEFFGATRFQVSAAYRDGGVAFKEVAANVNLPSRPPAQFHADTFAVTAIRFDLDNPSLRLQPWAIYANIPERVYLDARYVSYSIASGVGPPVVSLDPNGVVHGLRTGTATIIGRFGSLTDQVQVNVEAEQR